MDTTEKKTSARPEGTDLHRHYGRIGISAVAAAVRYQAKSAEPKEPSATTLGELDRRGLAA